MTEEAKLTVSSNGGSRPVPDPTVLTHEAIQQAAKSMRDYVDGQLATRDERLAGIDEATKLRLAGVEAIPSQIDKAVGALDRLMVEKFDSAERQRIEQKQDTKAAVDAALSAAKEAVKEQTTASERSIGKSETAVKEQLTQQGATFTTAIEGLRRSIDELKDRQVEDTRSLRSEIGNVAAIANGQAQQKVGATENRTGLYAAIGVIGTILGILIAASTVIAILKP